MDAEPQPLPIECTDEGVTTHGMVWRCDLTLGERTQRAGKLFGIFFLAAFITLFVPILHFILPPLALIIGSILSWGEFTNKGEILRGQITCPNCKTSIVFPRGGEEWPKVQRCDSCSLTLTFTKST